MSENINIMSNKVRSIPASQVIELYKHIGWWPDRKVEDIQRVIDNGVAVAAWYGEQLIGFSRAVTDGTFRAYIEDVAVYEQYRKNGIGDRIIEEIIKELSDIDIVSLFCEEKLSNFYERQSFKQTNQSVMHRTRKTK